MSRASCASILYWVIMFPFNRDIQQVLVDIGDKEHSFIGSRQWIGSTEVSFVLEKLLNVSVLLSFTLITNY